MNAPEQVPTDERLVKAALSGDDDAFSELVRRHKQKIFRLAARFVRDSEELDDICQEAFIKAYQSLRKFRGDLPLSTGSQRLRLMSAMMCSGSKAASVIMCLWTAWLSL